MHKIGYLSLCENVNEEYKKSLIKSGCRIENVELNRLNEDLQLVETLLIEDSDGMNINLVCELIMTIRKQSSLPIWVLSLCKEKSKVNRIVYLQLGADGVINREYDPDEFSLMVRNLIQRIKSVGEGIYSREHSLVLQQEACFQLIPSNLSVCLEDGEEINLTKLEFLTIEYLHKHAKKAMSYEEIYKNVWNDSSKNRKYRVSNLVFHLRKKLEKDVDRPQYIKTIRSKGYMLNI